MTREYLRVTPIRRAHPDVISTAVAGLHKLSAAEPDGVIARLTPFRSEQPVTFEFLAISDGTNEPVSSTTGPTPSSMSTGSSGPAGGRCGSSVGVRSNWRTVSPSG